MATDPSPTLSRRARARQARDAFPPMGVVAVRNLATGQVRVKASPNAPGTLNRLRFELKLGSHTDKRLQAEWDTHGPDAFSLEVLELVRERDDPTFDYAAELALLEQLYRAELASEAQP